MATWKKINGRWYRIQNFGTGAGRFIIRTPLYLVPKKYRPRGIY